MAQHARQKSTINSWMELAALTAQCANGKWIFRGETMEVSKDGTPQRELLRPKAGRESGKKGSALRVKHSVQLEQKALAEFIRSARPHLGHTPATDLEWLAIAQHHGMSTRLLDWTENLFIAAYFATQRSNTAYGLIYGIQSLRPVSRRDERRPLEVSKPAIYRPPHITPRVPAQRSVFTLHPNPTREFKPRSLHEWVVSPTACNEIRKILDSCAVNEGSIYPDLDGLSRHIGWRYKWGDL
jgi:hypothetical protein